MARKTNMNIYTACLGLTQTGSFFPCKNALRLFFKRQNTRVSLEKEVQKWPKMLLVFFRGKISEFRDVDMNKFKKEKKSRH